MKSAKKIFLLVLSLVLLVGIFAVATLAEDAPATATVVYPDGSTDTVAVGDTIIPKEFKTEGDAKLYYGAGNTLYKDAGEGWIFTLEKFAEPLTDLTVTDAMAGRNIIVTGADKVYFTHTADGVTKYNTSLSTHATNLTDLLYTPALTGSDIKLYADMTTGQLLLRSAHATANYLDLNGHRLTVNTTGPAIETRAKHFGIYSSQPGAVLDASNCNRVFYTNDDNSSYDKEHNTANPDNTVTVCQHQGLIIFGERATAKTATTTENGKNITVLCQTIANSDLWGDGGNSAILGGTFIQTGSAEIFVRFTRLAPTVKNCSFVITNAATVPVVPAVTRTFVGCNFVYAGEGSISLTNGTTTGYFNDCNFVNITPSYTVAHTYNANCAFGTTSCYPTEALKDSVYLAHGTTSKEITVNGVTYTLDGVLISDPATALTLTRGTLGTDYWVVGATIASDAGLSTIIVDGKIHSDASYDYSAIAQINAAGVITAAGTATAPIEYATVQDAAFTYQVDGEEMQFVASLGTPEEDGANFVRLLNDVCNVKIVMYSDIVLPSGVRFGTMVNTAGDNTTHTVTQKPYYLGPGKGGSASVFGSVDWDLNGKTVTVAADATSIPMIAWTESQGPQSNNVLHYPGYAKFNLYSSVEGGKYINLSEYTIFGINKYSNASYCLGAGDDNLTIVSKGQITGAYETGENGPAGYTLTVNGGTYVSSTSGAVFSVGRTAKINNAKILATGGAYAIFANHFWSDGTSLTLDNVTMIASTSTTQMVTSGAFSVANGNGKTHYIYLNNTIAFSGGTLSLAYTKATFTVNGTIMTDTAENLAVAYPTAPEGQTLAYTGISVYGERRAVGGYYSAPEAVTIVNATQNETKLWLVGEERFFVGGDPSSSSVMKVDGVWYYYTAPVWEATLGGNVVAIESVCAAENAGKTVTVAIGGEKEKLYYSYATSSSITYYYGDTAVATLSTLLSPEDSQRHEFRFYSDIEVSSGAASYQLGHVHPEAKTTGKQYDSTLLIDLNGYKWTVNSSNGYAFIVTGATSFIYSSIPGGILDVSKAAGIACTDGSADAYFGEATKTGSEYGQNLTVYCKSIHSGRWWSNNGYIVGGTYIQPEGITASHFFGIDDGPAPVVRNSTFIVNSLSNGFVRGVKGSFTSCVFIAKEASNIVTSGKSNSGATFTGCYFYNVIPNIPEGTAVTYTDCYFGNSSTIPQTGGYIAYTGDSVTLTANGKKYVFGAQLLSADQVALVDWGFGITEYWKIGTEATHENAVVDGVFGYTFGSVSVTASENKAVATLAAIKPGALQMNLSLQSKIGVNLFVNAALSNATVTFGDKTYTLADLVAEGGYYAFDTAIAPNVADIAINVEITIGDNTHIVPVSVGEYAEKILGSATYADAHNLTYAMVEYVRAAAGNDDFLADVKAPAGYEAQTLTSTESGNKKDGLLSSIAFQLDGTIAIAIQSAKDGENFVAEGKTVTLELGNGRKVTATVENGKVLFENLYVNEFYGDLKISVEGDDYTYNYSLANYLYGIGGNSAAVQALYNYAYYADAYVDALAN